ncbi:fosmidomycin resistance protein [Halobacteriales archaeon QS_6_64_34]|nr:MAG: fosmidomycin resistance protein [Halobacteriales archaeon QS_6_64_34]
MLTTPEWLTLEVKYPDRMTAFYEAFLELDVVAERDGETVLAAGETDIRLRAPGPVPRGGLHTHYALTVPEREYDDWYDRLDDRFDLVEHSFGDARSLYFYDPEGNCVELGERPLPTDRSGVCGLFELVLEVEELDIELWASRLGIADARGGVHVDVGVAASEPRATAREIADEALAVTSVGNGVRVRDPDGHYVTLVG